MKRFHKDIFLAIFLAFPFLISSQLYINEFTASNSGIFVDPDFGDSGDWIELYNAGEDTLQLKGFTITDNLSNPTKWRFTIDISIAPDSFLLIWCDDRSTGLHTNFKLSAEGEQIGLFNPEGILVDSISFGPQLTNVSMGRRCDGCSDWVFFPEASPGKSNTGLNYDGLVKSVPHFYPLGSIFNQPVQLEIRNIFEGEIRFTRDGTEPTLSSELYTKPLMIDTTTIIRARIFNGEQIKPGEIITHSYFINYGQIGNLPVVSLVTEPDNFWDPDKGIYVQSFKPEWEVPINIELFENDGSDRAAFNMPAGTKINGLYSWQLPQKMLGIYFRKRYGAGKLDYPLFFDRKASRYDSFALRASGNDWSRTLFRDGMYQLSTQLNMDNEVQGYRPCVVFINGRYMGVHNIRSKVDDEFIVNEWLPAGTKIDMIENEKVVEAGDFINYQQFKNLYSNDLSVAANYEAVAKQMDMDNFMDFMIAEIYGGNQSVGHNVVAWKPKEYGKWRWIPVDMDRALFNPTEEYTSFFIGKSVYPFAQLMQNNNFRMKMGYRLADHMFTTFNPQRMAPYIKGFADNIREELPRHILRWAGTSSSYGNPIPSLSFWEKSIARMNTFMYQRSSLLLKDWQQYGLQEAVNLTIISHPAQHGNLTMNGMTVPLDNITGLYPRGGQIQLKATPLPGINFKGWKILTDTTLIQKGAEWHYFDQGSGIHPLWNTVEFDASSWASGFAELGYGDGDETTRISFGPSSSNKYPSAYFRKEISIEALQLIRSLRLSIKIDDGAVVYLNGSEVARINIEEGPVAYGTLAAAAIPHENTFTDLIVPVEHLREGINVIAVSVHQNAVNSSDMSFDFALHASIEPSGEPIKNENLIDLNIDSHLSVMAIFDDEGHCVIPAVIDHDLTLTAACSPYLSRGDVEVLPGVKLTIEPGVEIRMAADASMIIRGQLLAYGTVEKRITIRANQEHGAESWGALILHQTTDTCHLHYLTLEAASKGPNPITQDAAISLFYADAIMSHLVIEDVGRNPILARYSSVELTKSSLHSNVTGDLINVKYGKARIEHCTFRGNNQVDTDAIDYDDVSEGIIRNCVIYGFYGYNSDGIDIGERALGVVIDSVLIYNVADKGISVGQQSMVTITNSIIVNTDLGVAAKDSSTVTIDQVTFYGNNIAVSSFEKNIGRAGGNVSVYRSILANSNIRSFEYDPYSRIYFAENITDKDTLDTYAGNIFGNPQFVAGNRMNFTLKDHSLARNHLTGKAWGATLPQLGGRTSFVTISGLYIGDAELQDAEFIVLTNPGDKSYDLSGYQFMKGITYTFPQETVLSAGESLIITNDSDDMFWSTPYLSELFTWSAGRLNNSGEVISLANPFGVIIDQVQYHPQSPWPDYLRNTESYLQLKELQFDNHYGENWTLLPKSKLLSRQAEVNKAIHLKIYPNPASEVVVITMDETIEQSLQIYTSTGVKVMETVISGGLLELDVSNWHRGIYLIRAGALQQKIMIR